MEDLVEKLRRLGLTRYEAKAYLSLLKDNLSSAVKLSEKSEVPRTRIYAVLESLRDKGWVRVYSGMPILFRAIRPDGVLAKVKENYEDFLASIGKSLNDGVVGMMEKFVIKRSSVGLSELKDETRKAKTVWLGNATMEFVEKMRGAFRDDAEVRVLLFPGERKTGDGNVEFKEAEIEVVSVVRNKEVPSMSVLLDEERTFTVLKDPVSEKYMIEEMLYDECGRCFLDWYALGWSAGKEGGG
ncbi:MAG: TrmB family transcriptional regulator [Thermoplasmata archaeon]